MAVAEVSNEAFNKESRIEQLKMRTKRCVCRYCGGKLELRRIIFSDIQDARTEIFCSGCDMIEYGVEPELYAAAQSYIDYFDIDFFADEDKNEQTHRMNIARAVDIMAWGCEHMSLLDGDGFKVPVQMKDCALDRFLIVHSDEVPDEEEKE